MTLLRSLFALLVFPGLAFALPLGFFMMGAERKLRARMQRRIGPPVWQTFFDFTKLLGKAPVSRRSSDKLLLKALPLLAVGTMVGALALLPISAVGGGFTGDLILFVGLLEMPPLFLVLAGYTTRSIYGEVGATREAVMTIVSNIPFLGAFIAMATAAGSLELDRIVVATPWSVRVPALLAIVLTLPIKLRMNPFSITNAEQEILAGPLTEYDGRRLALWELAHGLEWVALAGAVATLAAPWRIGNGLVDALVFTALTLLSVPVLTLVASATGRFKLAQATRLFLRWPTLAAGVAIAAAMWARHGGQ